MIPASRRERARDATTAEIKATARRLLVQDGRDALTLRAIAREMGMTAPGLYRYFASHDDLVVGVCHDILDELTVVLLAARDTVPLDDPIGRLGATCRAFRRWALEHPAEFQLSFATSGAAPGQSGPPPPPGPLGRRSCASAPSSSTSSWRSGQRRRFRCPTRRACLPT